MTRPKVFLDCETSGLDPARHAIFEIAYAVDDGPILSSFVTHTRITLDAETIAAAQVNRYIDRCPPEYATLHGPSDDDGDDHPSAEFEDALVDALRSATMVGANPAFDAAMLRARWCVTPWHHRLLDIEAYAAGAFGWTELRGLAGVAEHLGVQAPDHTAAGDVACLRACWQAIQTELDA